MTKMAAISIYDKNPSKIFFCRTGRLISTKLGVKHWWLKYFIVYINQDYNGLDLFYGKANTGRLCIWMEKTVKLSFKGKILQQDWILMNNQWFWRKKSGPQGSICPNPGAIYMSITTIFKPLLFWNRLASRSQIFYEAGMGRVNQCVYKLNPDDMTKMTTMPIYGKKKNLLKSCFPDPVDWFQRNLAWSIDD